MMDLETTCHVSCFMCHMLLFNLSQTVRARDLQCPLILLTIIYVSGVTCYLSCVMCNNIIIFFVLQNFELIGEGFLINRAYPVYKIGLF